MKFQNTLFFLFIVFSRMSAQEVTLSGYVEEFGSGEKLIGANVLDPKSMKGTTTNEYGFYSLTLPSHAGTLIFSYVGYQRDTIEWDASIAREINIRLNRNIQLETIHVQAERVKRIEEESQMSRNEVPVEQIQRLPALLGESDVLKTLQLLPGVQSGTEGTSGIFVRGGSIDQNLILVDGVPIYNPTHVLGIFSAFNADAVKSVSITKGGFPARYGGRLSSIVDVNMRDGHLNEYHGSGQIGLVSSKLLLEGPIVPEKSSFLVSMRRSYIDLIAKPVVKAAQKSMEEKVIPTAFFHDINVKANHRFNDKHRLVFSGYFGADQYGVNYKANLSSAIVSNQMTDTRVKWGNYLSSLNWNHRLSSRMFANTTLTFSRYRLNNDIEYTYEFRDYNEYFSSLYYSGIDDVGLKYNLDYAPGKGHYIKAGMNFTHHTYSPGALNFRYNIQGEKEVSDFDQEGIRSLENAFFIEDDIEYGRLKANVGLHYSQFFTGEQFYHSLQPRVGLRYKVSPNWAIKASYADMTQYINLLTSEALSLPTDLWVPVTDRLRPQSSWQAAVGTATTLWKNFELSIEGYYKEMHNVLSYKPGISFILGANSGDWEDKVTQGKGWSYGSELMFQKKFGKTTGWIAYTLSWNNRQFAEINRGKIFPFKYDRRHDFSFVLSHDLSEKWSFSGSWIYGTGNAYSIPDTYYSTPREGIFNNFGNFSVYTEKNNHRMSDYHRLDLSFMRKKEKKWGETFWTFGAYNTYFRKNPFFIYQDYDNCLKEVAVLPVIPYFSWGFKF